MNREEIETSMRFLIGAMFLGDDVLNNIKKNMKKKYSIILDKDDLHYIIQEEVLNPDIIEFIKENENRRKSTDRRQNNIKVEKDRRRGTDRRLEDRRTELQRRLQELEVSIDTRTFDRKRGFV
ncbi:hypothetical protein ACFL6H_02135 [Candidatus Latescibacterota bacterium]